MVVQSVTEPGETTTQRDGNAQGESRSQGGGESPAQGESPVFRHAGISYLRIPARDARQSAAFYQAVFGWTLSGDPDDPSFADGTGHVIGHWRTDLPVAGEAGVPFFPEGDLWVATFRDPAGNVFGVWQHGPRQ